MNERSDLRSYEAIYRSNCVTLKNNQVLTEIEPMTLALVV